VWQALTSGDAPEVVLIVAFVPNLPGMLLGTEPLYPVQVIANGIVQPQVADDQRLPSRLDQRQVGCVVGRFGANRRPLPRVPRVGLGEAQHRGPGRPALWPVSPLRRVWRCSPQTP